MTFSGWLSLGVELLIIGIVLGALARLGGCTYRLIRAEIRTWRIQQEKDAIWQIERQRLLDMPQYDRQRFVNAMNSARLDRIQLDGLATAADKTARRIVH